MRINVYAEEMTDRVEIIAKEIDGHNFTGLRLYLELPATVNGKQYQGPFMHRPGDDDSSAVTFWGKRDLRTVLRKMLTMLDEHYEDRDADLCYFGKRDTCMGKANNNSRCSSCQAAFEAETLPAIEVELPVDPTTHTAAPAALGWNVIEFAPPGAVTLTATQREDIKRELEVLQRFRASAPLPSQHSWAPLYKGAAVEQCRNCPVQRRDSGCGSYHWRNGATEPFWHTAEIPNCQPK